MNKNFKTGEDVSNENVAKKSKNGFKNKFSFSSFKRLIGGKQRKVYFSAFTAVFAVVAAMLIFYSCQKDVEAITSKGIKSLGNYPQPTQNITIVTSIYMNEVTYFVQGNAIVGNLNGQIYECNVEWTMEMEGMNGTIELPMSLNAILNSEYLTTMTFIEPVAENYTITMNIPLTATEEVILEIDGSTEEFIFEVEDNVITIVSQEVLDLWDNMVEVCAANAEIDFSYSYILALSQEAGINIFELAESPFLLEYINEINTFNAYFLENVQNNPGLKSEFKHWANEFIHAPIWEEGVVITQEHHRFYIAAQQLSHIYFGNNFGYTVEFDGVYYNVAMDRINSMMNSNSVFKQNLESQFPQYVYLDKELQKNVIKGGLSMLPQYDRTSCERRCDVQFDSDWSETYDEFNEYIAACKTRRCRINNIVDLVFHLMEIHDVHDYCVGACWGF